MFGWGNSAINREPTVYERWRSVEIEPHVKCLSMLKDGKLQTTPIDAPDVKTSWDVFRRGLSIAPKGNCLGWRSGDHYDWWNYEQVAERVGQLCAAFKTKTTLSRQDLVGIYASSCPLWIISALAINARSLCIVPLYDSLGPDSRSYILNQADMSVIFVDSPAAVDRVLESAKETLSLKTIISFTENLSSDLLEKAQANSISLISFNDFVSGVNSSDPDVYDEPKDEDIAVVQYTSGTTGYPKGVVITHKAYVSNMGGIDYPFAMTLDPNAFTIKEKDIMLLFLPLAHMYAQIVCTWFFFHGSSVGFYGGNITKVIEDAGLLKPTFIPLVPRIMNRLYNKIKSEIGNKGLRANIFWYCYARKKAIIQERITRDTWWDYIAFRPIQRLLGGNVRFVASGSAPISAEVLEFWRICFGCLIVEGYGQSETSVIATMAFGPTGGNVGHPLSCNYVKLVDAEECGYFVKDGKGEICVKGPNVMSGYYKQPDKTAEVIDADGWLHTGDIGEFMSDGSLSIFDRKKHIFKLSQGEYIAPEKIENVYLTCSLVAQIFVDGTSLESYTVAIVVPDSHAAKSWAKSNNANPDTLMSNRDFVKYVLTEMLKTGKEYKLNSLEQVKSIHLTADAFSTANDLLTPSLKNRRPQLRNVFKDQIAALYKAGPLIS